MSGTALSVVTLFPQLVEAVGECGITSRAIDKNHLVLSTVNPRDFATDKHRTVDDRPYGGGPGMVMRVAPLASAIEQAKAINVGAAPGIGAPLVVYASPQGERLDHKLVVELAQRRNLVVIAGRYEGIDERLIELHVDREVSIGDYVLSGGELAAMVIVDAIARQLPGVLGNEESAQQDSFAEGLLDCAHYTRPEEYADRRVPSVLLGGDHGEIRQWRRRQAIERTWSRRPELVRALLESTEVDAEEKRLLQKVVTEMMDASNSAKVDVPEN